MSRSWVCFTCLVHTPAMSCIQFFLLGEFALVDHEHRVCRIIMHIFACFFLARHGRMCSGTYLADPALPSNVRWTRPGLKCRLCVTSTDDNEADPNTALLSVVVKISEDGFWLSRYVFEFWQYHAGFKYSFIKATLPGPNRPSHPLR